jgi:chromosomal replication initiator protein
MTQFIEAVQQGEMADFRHRFRDVDVLVVDDIHFLAKRDRTQEEFFHTFNALYQANKQIMLSSDAPPEEIPDLEERLVSRFKWGLVAKIEPPCYETRVEIVKAKARIRGLEIPDDVACYIAERINANIRELEGAVTKLQIQSPRRRPPHRSRPRRQVRDGRQRQRREQSPRSTPSSRRHRFLRRPTRRPAVQTTPASVALPRQVCMYLARRLTRLSLEEIGGLLRRAATTPPSCTPVKTLAWARFVGRRRRPPSLSIAHTPLAAAHPRARRATLVTACCGRLVS